MKKVSSNRNAVIIFSKGADPGQVKTRLRPLLTEKQCLALHLAFLQDTYDLVKSLNIPAYLFVAGNSKFPFSCTLPILPQVGDDLGLRLKNAFERKFLKHNKIVVIGTDSPDLSSQQIRDALNYLHDHDVVIGPTEDGGYYLLGLSRMIPEVFEDIPWGTNQVFQRTIEKIRSQKLHVLPTHYDVDVIEDLIRLDENLQKDQSIALKTQLWLEENRSAIMVRPDDTPQSVRE